MSFPLQRYVAAVASLLFLHFTQANLDLSSDFLLGDSGGFDAAIIAPEEKIRNMSLDSFPDPVKFFTPYGAKSVFPKASCFRVNRELIFDHLQARPRLFLAWAEDNDSLDAILEALEGTVLQCPDRIETGYLASTSRFAFFLPLNASIAPEDVFRSKMRRHRGVAVYKQMSDNEAIIVRCNIYKDEVSAVGLWNSGGENVHMEQLFEDFPMDGFVFNVTANPYAVYMDADAKAEPIDPRRAFENHTAYEIALLNEFCEILDCGIDLANPASQIWGSVNNGSASGLFRDIATGLAHFAVSAVYANIDRARVVDFTAEVYLRDSDSLAFAVKKPGEKISLFKIVSPFPPLLWLVLLSSMFVVAFTTFVIANLENKIIGRTKWPCTWSTWWGSAWFTFGTSMGESFTNSASLCGSWGLRIALVSWFLSALIASTAYSGSLNAFLMSPEMELPIDSLTALAESGLRWNMVVYGEQVEERMATSKDPVIRRIWDEKVVVDYEIFPYNRLKQAYEGASAMIEWLALLESTMTAGFVLPNGEELVHVAKDLRLQPSIYSCWAFYPLNPWLHRFDRLINTFTESGIIFYWRKKARQELKNKLTGQLTSKGVVTPSEELIVRHEESQQALSMQDFAGPLVCFQFAMGISIVFFLAEVLWRRIFHLGKI